jgi:hypothetical protein
MPVGKQTIEVWHPILRNIESRAFAKPGVLVLDVKAASTIDVGDVEVDLSEDLVKDLKRGCR